MTLSDLLRLEGPEPEDVLVLRHRPSEPALARALPWLADQPAAFNLATIAAVSALGYANWRGADDNWREGCGGLGAWYDAMMQNSDVAESAPVF